MSEEKVITNINETPDSGAAGAEGNVLEVDRKSVGRERVF